MKRSRIERKTPLRRSLFRRRRSQALEDMHDQDVAMQEWAATQECLRCGARERVVGHHLIRRKFLRYRHELANIMTLCRACHGWAHAYPDEFDEWMSENYRQWKEWLDINLARAHQGLGPKEDA